MNGKALNSMSKNIIESIDKKFDLHFQDVSQKHKMDHSFYQSMIHPKSSRKRASSTHLIKKLNEITESIEFDIDRTFNYKKCLDRKANKNLLRILLNHLSCNISKFGYIQGMNFWVSSIVYHCKEESHALKILSFIYNKLEMSRVYCFDEFEHFIDSLKLLLKNHVKLLYSFIKTL